MFLRFMMPALLGVMLFGGHAFAQSSNTGTVRTQSYLLNNEFQDGQPASSITPQDMRDLIVSLGQGNLGVEIDFFMYGVPNASAVVPKLFSRTTVIPANAAIKCNALAGATSATTITLTHVVSGSSTNVGTLVFAASGSANQGCTATFSSAVTFAAGDLLEAVFPSTADTTLAGINISIPALQ